MIATTYVIEYVTDKSVRGGQSEIEADETDERL